jgi:hypothetical protein
MEADPKTVVVAEDEILIRMLAVEGLTDAGFEESRQETRTRL